MKNFFRKVAFGIGPDEKIPSDPLTWATSQIKDKIPDFSYKGKIYSEKDLRKHYGKFVYQDRKVLRKNFKKIRKVIKRLKIKLEMKQDKNFGEI